MNEQTGYLAALVLVTGGVTFLLRAFPFAAFGGTRRAPAWIDYLGSMLSPAAIAMLVVYCFCSYFQGKTMVETHWGIPESAAGLTVVVLQLCWKSPLVSILAGTALYMALVQNL